MRFALRIKPRIIRLLPRQALAHGADQLAGRAGLMEEVVPVLAHEFGVSADHLRAVAAHEDDLQIRMARR